MAAAAEECVGTLAVRVVGHPVESRLSELHFVWTIDNWMDANAKAMASVLVDTPDAEVEIGSPTVSNLQMGLECSGNWKFDLTRKKHDDGGTSSVDLRFTVSEVSFELDAQRVDDDCGAVWRATAFLEPNHERLSAGAMFGIVEWNWCDVDGELEDIGASVSITRGTLPQLMEAKSVSIEMTFMFLDCPYSRSFQRPRKATTELTSGMLELYKAGSLTDFVLVTSDNTQLKCHRSALAATCEVFKAMLGHDTKERRTGICEIEDIDYQTMETVVDSLYGVDVSTRVAVIPDKVFLAADKYGVEELKKQCIQLLIVTVTVENVVDRYVLAKRHELADLMERVVEFVRENYTEFADREGHREMIEKAGESSVEFFKLIGVAPNPKKPSAPVVKFE